LAWAVLATGVSAQNGLERFEREIKPQIQLEKFAYGGFSLQQQKRNQ
jgi:hypothetical protein